MLQVDNGDGTYNIMQGDQSLGVGYKGVADAIGEIGYKNANLTYEVPGTEETVTPGYDLGDGQWHPETVTPASGVRWANPLLTTARNEWIPGMNESGGESVTRYDPTYYLSKEDLEADLRRQTAYTPSASGILGDWEALGQVLGGKLVGDSAKFHLNEPDVKQNLEKLGYGDLNLISYQDEGGTANSKADEAIKGTDALYGSTPVFGKGEDGKYELIGYRTDIAPGGAASADEDFQHTESSAVKTHESKKLQYVSAVWREMADTAWWQSNTVIGEDGTTFIPKEVVKDIAGWVNKDTYEYQETGYSRFTERMGKLLKATDPITYKAQGGDKFYEQAAKEGIYAASFDKWDPIISKIDPLHKIIDKPVSKALGFDSPKEAFSTIAPIVVAIVAAYFTAGAATAAAAPAAGGGLAAGAGATGAGLTAGTGAGLTAGAGATGAGLTLGTGSGITLAAGAGVGSSLAASGAAALTAGQIVGYGLNGLNVANSVAQGNYASALTTLLSAGVSSGAFDAAFSSVGSGISDLAQSAGMSSELTTAVSDAAKGFFKGDLSAMTGGVIDLGKSANMVIGSAVKNAVTKAALAGASGADLEQVMQTALLAGISSLVGGTVATGTNNSLAGTVAGSVTGGLLNQATRPDAPSPTPSAPVADPKPTTTPTPTHSIARMAWR
jgi:hypothetical protein